MGISLIIFDLDGTLVDSSGDLTAALNHAAAPLGHAPLTSEQVKRLVGEGVSRLVEKILPDSERGFNAETLERFRAHYQSHLTDQTRPYSGVVDTLPLLAGYKKALVSNKEETLSRNVLAEFGLLDHFDIVMGSDSAPEKKPSPVPLLLAAERLGIKPCDSVIVGDSEFDIMAGHAAGILTIGAAWGFRTSDELLAAGADYIARSFHDLPRIIREIEASATE
ncbi:MAG: HAD-IA family hydrolase [Nitrospirae bacterium]|nr:HAD-IA family hydrolase [Nitrospirota bacterium]